ncbi:MAG TPA: hypothetical protein VFF69_15610 [Phycisphaerales bacterium]|nr:hypothetical protein [Phycisphaerales bacterium]
MMRLALIAAVSLLAGAAGAQTMTYFWTVTTDNGDTNLTPGEWVYLGMWAWMDPEEVGFSGTIYDIVGSQNWDTGEILSFVNRLGHGMPGDNGDLLDNNNIVSIEAFQLPPIFNPDFDADNPIHLYEIVWKTDDYEARVVEVGDANHLNNAVYTDRYGSSLEYEGIPGVARFTVNVPGPVPIAALGIAGACGLTRRRPFLASREGAQFRERCTRQ